MDWTDITKWTLTTIVIPLTAWAGARIERRFGNQRAAQEKRMQTLRFLIGLPPECKAILEDCHIKRTHTFGGQPLSKPIEFLIEHSILIVGQGYGRWGSDTNLTIEPYVWNLLDDWYRLDDTWMKPLKEKNTNS